MIINIAISALLTNFRLLRTSSSCLTPDSSLANEDEQYDAELFGYTPHPITTKDKTQLPKRSGGLLGTELDTPEPPAKKAKHGSLDSGPRPSYLPKHIPAIKADLRYLTLPVVINVGNGRAYEVASLSNLHREYSNF